MLSLIAILLVITFGCWWIEALEDNEVLVTALEKIADPRKRDHTEPDLYTENACLMTIADEALKEWNDGR